MTDDYITDYFSWGLCSAKTNSAGMAPVSVIKNKGQGTPLSLQILEATYIETMCDRVPVINSSDLCIVSTIINLVTGEVVDDFDFDLNNPVHKLAFSIVAAAKFHNVGFININSSVVSILPAGTWSFASIDGLFGFIYDISGDLAQFVLLTPLKKFKLVPFDTIEVNASALVEINEKRLYNKEYSNIFQRLLNV